MVNSSVKELIAGYLRALENGDERSRELFDDKIYKFIEACGSVAELRSIDKEGLSKRVVDLIDYLIIIYERAEKRAEDIANQFVEKLNEEQRKKLVKERLLEQYKEKFKDFNEEQLKSYIEDLVKDINQAKLKELAKKRIKKLAEDNILELAKARIKELGKDTKDRAEEISTFIESLDVDELESLKHVVPKKKNLFKP